MAARRHNVTSVLRPFSHQNRQLFFQHGSYGAIDIQISDNNYSLLHEHCAVESRNNLCASGPSLPLFPPNKVDLPWSDVCEETRRYRHVDLKSYQLLLKRTRAAVSKSETKQQQLLELQNHLSNLANSPSETDSDIPPPESPKWFTNICDSYPELFESKQSLLFNEDFSGGCLSYQSTDCSGENGILISPHGKDLKSLQLQDVQIQNGGIRCKPSNVVKELDYPILEVKSSIKKDQLLCLSRTYNCCYLYSVTVNADSLTNWKQEKEIKCGDVFTSICTSPFIHGEWISCDETGSAKLYTINGNEHIICKNHEPRFACSSRWRQAYFSGHPRLVTIVDRTAVENIDIRTASNTQMTDLFVLPNTMLQNEERIMCAKVHPRNHFYHFIATDYSILVMDERFPGHPVLNWRHSLTSPPQYIDVTDSAIENNDILLVSSQDRPETECMQFSLAGPIAQSKCPPWRVSKVNDFLHYDSVMFPGYDCATVEKRLTSSLLGVCGIPHPNKRGFTALQLSSFGDVFHQAYQPSPMTSDKTYSAGPGVNNAYLTSEDKATCFEWLQTIDRQIEDAALQLSDEMEQATQKCDVSNSFKDSSWQKTFPHVNCSLCCQTVSEVIPADKLSDVCHSCGNTVEESRSLKQLALTNKVLPSTSGMTVDAIPGPDPDRFRDPDSELLLKLWKGDEVIQALEKVREQRRSEYKMQKKRALGSSSPPNKRRRRLSGSSTASLSSVRSTSSVYIPGFSFESPARIFSPKLNITESDENNTPVLNETETFENTTIDEDLDQLDSFDSQIFSSTPWNPTSERLNVSSFKTPTASPRKMNFSHIFTPQSPAKSILNSLSGIKNKSSLSPKKGKRISKTFISGF